MSKGEYLSMHCCKAGQEANSVEVVGGAGCLQIAMFSDSGLVVLSPEDESQLLALLLARAGGLHNLALADCKSVPFEPW